MLGARCPFAAHDTLSATERVAFVRSQHRRSQPTSLKSGHFRPNPRRSFILVARSCALLQQCSFGANFAGELLRQMRSRGVQLAGASKPQTHWFAGEILRASKAGPSLKPTLLQRSSARWRQQRTSSRPQHIERTQQFPIVTRPRSRFDAGVRNPVSKRSQGVGDG